MTWIAGLFVGGKGSRMGGAAKGLLDAPDGRPIVVRTRSIVEAAGGAACVLVGAHPAYAELGLPVLPDDPAAAGPLAGLLALLQFAQRADGPSAMALALACDLPQLTTGVVGRLVAAPRAPVVAPRRHHTDRGWLWEPLVARYDSDAVLPKVRAFAARGDRRLQSLLDELGAAPLALEPGDDDALVDWDTSADILSSKHDALRRDARPASAPPRESDSVGEGAGGRTENLARGRFVR